MERGAVYRVRGFGGGLLLKREESFSGVFLVPWDYAAIKGAVSDKKRYRE
jgi:hypothetical protein